jgi:protein TonB
MVDMRSPPAKPRLRIKDQTLSDLVEPEDYPPAALRAEESGAVGLQLVIGTDGRAFDCRITASSGSAILDRATCDMLKRRSRFWPALDHRGKPVVALVDHGVTWSLP